MKALLALVAIALAALLAYNFINTGKVALIPPSLSRDEQALQRIAERFETARRQFEAAGRAAGVSGADTTADAEAARRDIDKADADLAALTAHLGGALKAKADQLRNQIEAFRDEMR